MHKPRHVTQRAGGLLADGSGAVGYLLKDRVARVGEFLDALDRVARGATVLDPQVIAQLLAGQRQDNALGGLTARGRQLWHITWWHRFSAPQVSVTITGQPRIIDGPRVMATSVLLHQR